MKGRSSRTAILAVILLGALIFSGVYYAWNTATDIFQPVSSGSNAQVIRIQIRKGESTAQIADDLQAKGLIRNALAFRIWARIKGLDTQLQAGGYDHLTTSMTISDIIDQLLNAQPDVLYVTVIEGWRIEQIAQALAQVGLAKFDVNQFLTYTKHPNQFPDAGKYSILKYIPKGDSMEGLLFPATYDIPTDGDARYVVNRMLTTMQDTISQYKLEAQAKAHSLNVYQMVILASLVQREIVNPKDAPGVAGVFWNRIMKVPNETAGLLGSDPSVEYARDSQTTPKHYWLPLQDFGTKTAANSPWNTYIYHGLPPTPICSPGLATLAAAASPTMSDYFYFLGKKDGGIVYAKNYQQFQQEEQQYLH